jgi:hypothetical protein
LTPRAIVFGMRWTAPMFVVAGLMRLAELYSPALREVTRATQRSVLAVMGKERRPTFALLGNRLTRRSPFHTHRILDYSESNLIQ